MNFNIIFFYICIFEIFYENWNYYENYRHITNNTYESYYAKLNKLFDRKPNFYKLLYELKLEEHNVLMTYKKRISGLLGTNKRRTLKTEKKLLIIQEKLDELKEMPETNIEEVLQKSDAWWDCLKKVGYGLLDN